MGNLAVTGIAFGQRIPVGDLARENSAEENEKDRLATTLGMLRRFCLLPIGEKIVDGAPLEHPQVVDLLNNAPMGALMKLLELRASARSRTPRGPFHGTIVSALEIADLEPLGERRGLILEAAVRQTPPDGRIVLSGRLASSETAAARLASFVADVKSLRRNVRVVLGSLVQLSPFAVSDSAASLDLSNALAQIAGFSIDEIVGCPTASLAAEASELGIDACWTLAVKNRDSRDLARAIIHGREVSGPLQRIKTWAPVLESLQSSTTTPSKILRDRRNPQFTPRSRDELAWLFRALAVGALALDTIPFTRALPELFPPHTTSLTVRLGANDFGIASTAVCSIPWREPPSDRGARRLDAERSDAPSAAAPHPMELGKSDLASRERTQ